MYLALEAVLKDGRLDRVVRVLDGQVWELRPQPKIEFSLGRIEFVGRMSIRVDEPVRPA